MSGELYVRLLSWHALVDSDDLTVRRTVCGRVPSSAAQVTDELPGTGKTCESCLRLLVRHEQKAAASDTPGPDGFPA